MDQVRWVDVAPGRLPGWVLRFGERHGGAPSARVAGAVAVFTAPDGERAECHLPPGAPADWAPPGSADGQTTSGTAGDRAASGSLSAPGAADAQAMAAAVAGAAGAAGRIGLLLVRRGGFAVGVADGPRLVASKVDSRYVQSRTAAGGWSQQRFARRRENQARASAGDAAEVCLRLLLPETRRLAALLTGGDRRSVEAVLADPRLAALLPLVAERFLQVPDPKLAVLEAAVPAARAVRIRVVPPEHRSVAGA